VTETTIVLRVVLQSPLENLGDCEIRIAKQLLFCAIEKKPLLPRTH
jgi:hypothetical protein